MGTQHTAYCQFRTVFGVASVFGIEVEFAVGQYLGSKLRSKLTGFAIEVGVTGIQTKRLVFQLVVDHCSN